MFNASAWRLDDFRVVISGAQLTTTATVKVYSKKLVFSKTAISELNYPAYVRILISEEADRMVVLPHFENDMTAIPFFKETFSEDEGRYIEPRSVPIVDMTLVKGIRKNVSGRIRSAGPVTRCGLQRCQRPFSSTCLWPKSLPAIS